MNRPFHQPPNQESMISVSNGLITGGTFSQTNTQTYNYMQGPKTGMDMLKDAIAPGAFHNSGERFDPPKCHPNTRTAVIQNIMDWILGQDPRTRNALIMWLYGAAGAGKSAIAQTIAELCYAKGLLVASFFFSRSDPDRNHAETLFPTIAYQVALAFPEVQPKLSSIIEHDPTIFSRSLLTQLSSLIVEPLQELGELFSGSKSFPCLVIIDGLDECLYEWSRRHEIMDAIFQGVRDRKLPFLFLIASRPEHDISLRFNCSKIENILTRNGLDNTYWPQRDIDQFLHDKFKEITETHPFKQFIPNPWPKADVIKLLVRKSSGQFIYASTIIKFVESSRHLPHHRLDIILELRSAERDMPFAELDALYRQIFSSVENLDLVLLILSYVISRIGSYLELVDNMDDLAQILSLGPGDIERLFCDLRSVIRLETTEQSSGITLHLLHASLSDFLLEKNRSGPYHIDLALFRIQLLRKCFQFLTHQPFFDHSLEHGFILALRFITDNIEKCSLTADLCHDILSFSITRIYNEALAASLLPNQSDRWHPASLSLLLYFNKIFLPYFFQNLLRMGHEAEALYTHHLQSLDSMLGQILQDYYSNPLLTLVVAGSVGVRDWSSENFPQNLVEIDARRLCLLQLNIKERKYVKFFNDYFQNPARSGKYALDGEKYATAALCILSLMAAASLSPFLANEYSALKAVAYFLHRASRSETLLACCRQAPISQAYSKHSCYEAALQAIQNYLERMDSHEHAV